LKMAATAGSASILLVAILLGILWLYHLSLIVTGQTTKEHLSRRRAVRGGHRRGAAVPLLADVSGEPTLLAPRGPRLFDPYAWVSVAALTEPSPTSFSCTQRPPGIAQSHQRARSGPSCSEGSAAAGSKSEWDVLV
jgi:hypothetical protein